VLGYLVLRLGLTVFYVVISLLCSESKGSGEGC
jgi:hypothetical protein